MTNKPVLVEDLVLRQATALDEPAIFRLIREGGINPMGVNWQRFVVIDLPEGRVIACGQIKPHADGTDELASLAVDKAWRGSGLARRLIEHLISSHPDPLYLMCAAHLKGLYEKFGFVVLEDDQLPRYFKRIKRLMKIPEKLGLMAILVMKRESPRE